MVFVKTVLPSHLLSLWNGKFIKINIRELMLAWCLSGNVSWQGKITRTTGKCKEVGFKTGPQEDLLSGATREGVLDEQGFDASSKWGSRYPIPPWIFILLRTSQGTCPPVRFRPDLWYSVGQEGKDRETSPQGRWARTLWKVSPWWEKQPRVPWGRQDLNIQEDYPWPVLEDKSHSHRVLEGLRLLGNFSERYFATIC